MALLRTAIASIWEPIEPPENCGFGALWIAAQPARTPAESRKGIESHLIAVSDQESTIVRAGLLSVGSGCHWGSPGGPCRAGQQSGEGFRGRRPWVSGADQQVACHTGEERIDPAPGQQILKIAVVQRLRLSGGERAQGEVELADVDRARVEVVRIGQEFAPDRRGPLDQRQEELLHV